MPAPNVIKHENTSRRIDVTCNVKARDLGSVAREIEAKVRGRCSSTGAITPSSWASMQRAKPRSRGYSHSAALASSASSCSASRTSDPCGSPVLVFLTLPFALIGGVVGAFLAGGVLSLGSLVGFVTVLGIAARNGIMLVSHFRHLEHEEGEPFGRELCSREVLKNGWPRS